MAEHTKSDADTEASVEAEIHALQAERVKHEQAMHAELRTAEKTRQRREHDVQKQWRDGLAAIDRKHRALARRLDVARAERLRAEAIAAQGPETAKPEAAAAAKNDA